MMTSSPSVAPQESEDRGGYWRAFGSGSSLFGDSVLPTLGKLSSGEISSSVDDLALKVRKPYTITKQRERWTEEEHTKFLEALKLYGRAWRRIEEHIGTKTAVQIRSHAQKFFSKLEREATAAGGTLAGVSQEIDIPPPRPKRKPSHPYPRKAGGSFSGSPLVADEDSSPPAAVSPLASKSGMSGDGVAKPAEFSPYSMPKPAPLDIPSPAASQPSGSPASLKLFGQTVVVPTAHMAAAARSSDVQTTIVSRACVSEGACETSEGRMQSGKDGKFLLSAAEARVGEKCGTRRLPAGSNVELLESGISVLEGGSDSNAATRAPHRGETSQSKRRDLCYQDSAGTSARSGEMSTPEGPYDYSQYRGTATVAHHLAAALNAGMHLHNMSAMPDKPPFTLMDFAALHPARFMAGFPGLPGLPAGPQHAAFNLESLARMTPWHTGAERPAFPTGVWPGLIPGATAAGLPVPMGIPLPSGMPRLRPGMECVGGQDDGGAAAAVAAATIAAASAWWALQGSVPPGVVHPGMAAMYNPSAAAAAVASVTEAVVVQNCRHPSRSSDHRGQQPEPEDEQQVGSNDSEDGVAGDSPARKSSAVKRAERASRMREQKARRGHFSAHAVCTDSSPGWGNSSRSTRAGSFCESSAFPGWMKIKGDKMCVNQKDVDKRPSPSSCNGDGVRKRARVRSMSGSNTPPGEGRHSDDGDKSGDERQPSSSDGSGSEAGDPPVGGSVRGRSSNSSGCGNTQGEGGRAAFFDGGSSDGEEMPQSRSPEEGGDNAVQSAHHGHSPEDKPQTGTGESNKQNEKITSSAAEQWRIEFDRVPTEEHLASQGPSGKEGSPTSVLQRLGSGDATPSSSPNTDCQSSHGQRNGGTARASDSSAPTCGGSHSQGGLRTGTTLNEVQETVSASREKDEEEASSLLETRKDQDRTLESNSEQDRDLCPSPDAGDAAAASQDDAAPKFQGTRGIDSNAEAHLQRLSMLRMCPTSASSCGSPRFSGIGFVPYQRTSTEASGTDSPGSKGERLHLRTEDACNFEGQSWRQKRPCTREEPAQA